MTPRALITAALLAALVLGTTATSGANAAGGAYTVSACSPGATAGAWQPVNTSPASMTSGQQCGGPAIGPVGSGDAGALYGEDLMGSASAAPPGARAGWQFEAPAGTAITAISYYRALNTGFNLDWRVGLFDGSGSPVDTCASNPHPCSSSNNQVPHTTGSLNTASLFFGAQCQPVPPDATCLPGSTLHDAQADLYSANVTLSESAAPEVTNVGGNLWIGAVASGTAPVTFSASDVSGISQVAVAGPAGAVALQPEACNYTQTQPCPQQPNGSLSVNTTRLRDGPQALTLFVTNAAGNTTTLQSPALVVDNNGPGPPGNLTASAVAGSTDAVELTWRDPTNPPQPVTAATAELCQSSCSGPVALGTGGQARLIAPGPGSYEVRFWLTDRAGRGGPTNATSRTVTIPSSPRADSHPTTPNPAKLRLSHHLRGRALTVTVKVPAGASGSVTLGVRAYHGTRRFARLTRRATARHGVATFHVRLSAAETRASKLALRATALHATAATLVLAPHHSATVASREPGSSAAAAQRSSAAAAYLRLGSLPVGYMRYLNARCSVGRTNVLGCGAQPSDVLLYGVPFVGA